MYADALKPTEELRQRSLAPKEQRGLLPSQTFSVSVVRNHRRWLSKDIDRLLTKAWDPSLSKDELQAVNDDINRLVKRKAEWDTRLVELGGVLEDSGNTSVAIGSAGYHYYGLAKQIIEDGGSTDNLSIPVVKEGSKRQGYLYQLVNAEYYGFDHEHPAVSPSIPAIDVPSDAQVENAILQAKKAHLLARLS